jgi:hypothetical protein
MTQHCSAALVAATIIALSGTTASPQTPKELKTKSGSPVVVVNFFKRTTRLQL